MAEIVERVTTTASGRPGGEQTLRIESVQRRVRNYFGGSLVADSKHPLLVWEPRRLPVYYFPVEDVRMDLLQVTERVDGSPLLRWDVVAGSKTAEKAAWAYSEDDAEHAALRDRIAFFWSKMDSWFEEDDEVFVHPRDPYHRVDVLNSSRHVKVVANGEVVAETTRPRLLFETSLPTRYYIPKLDVRMDLLEPTSKVTACPYKGRASYWSVRAGREVMEDLVWAYPAPIPECSKIENLLCFYNEKLDIYVDGELQPRPKTPWS